MTGSNDQPPDPLSTTEVVRTHDTMRAIVDDLRRLADDSGVLERVRKQLATVVRFDQLDVYGAENATLHGVETPDRVVAIAGCSFERAVVNRQPHVWMTLPHPTLPGDEHAVAAGMKSSICVPLLARGDVVGVLVLYSRTPYAFGYQSEAVGALSDVLGQFLLQRRLRALERTLDEARHELSAREKLAAVGQLASGVAHEVNNPAAYVLLNLEHMREELQRHRAELAPIGDGALYTSLDQAIDEGLDGVRRIRTIVADLQTFAKTPEAPLRPVSLDDAVLSAINMLSPEATARGGRIRTDLARVPTFLSSRDRIVQVVLNLVRNALQALSPDRGGEVRVRTSVQASVATLEVTDDGIGIPDAVKPRIFEPFFTTKGVGEGTGLGLATTREIVRKLGGTLRFESREGAGTTFWATFAMRPTAASLPVAATPPVATTTVVPNVLVVEDDALLRRSFARMLKATCRVTAAESAEEALAILARDATFDVLVTDIALPGASGIDLYEEIARRYPALTPRTFFLTGGALTAKALRFVEANPSLVLYKPVEGDTLRKVLRRIAEGVTAADALAEQGVRR